jgi:hypothetical protein
MKREPESEGDRDTDGGSEMTELLRRALGTEEPPAGDVLEGVQRRIRQRSAGKFYADGWSTAKQPPIATYLVTSLVMLAIVFVIYVVLSPLRGEARVVPDEPAPVQILPPR